MSSQLSHTSQGDHFELFFFRFYLFTFRERGREGEREGEKHWCVSDRLISCLSKTAPTGDLASNPACALTGNPNSDFSVCRLVLSTLTPAGAELFKKPFKWKHPNISNLTLIYYCDFEQVTISLYILSVVVVGVLVLFLLWMSEPVARWRKKIHIYPQINTTNILNLFIGHHRIWNI